MTGDAGGSGASPDDRLSIVRLDSQGKIVAAGCSMNALDGTELAMIRLTTAGVLDSTFNGTRTEHWIRPRTASADTHWVPRP